MTTCAVSGNITDVGLTAQANASVVFTPMPAKATADIASNTVYTSNAVSVTADAAGAFTADVVPGQYRVTIITATKATTDTVFVTVPVAATAFLAQIVNAPPPPTLDAAQQAVLAAQQARDQANAALTAVQAVQDTTAANATAATNSATAAAGSATTAQGVIDSPQFIAVTNDLQGPNNIGIVGAAIADVQTVAADKANIDAIVADKANIDQVAGAVPSVNKLATDLQSTTSYLKTVGDNMADVTTAAQNIAAIQAAPSSAAAAAADAASAANDLALAQQAVTDAQTARDQAMGAANMFVDVASGLAATAANGYFAVVGTGLLYASLYQNQAGVAVLLRQIYSSDKVDELEATHTEALVAQAAALVQVQADLAKQLAFT